MKIGSIRHYYKLITLLIILSVVPVNITGIFSYWKSSQAITEYSNQEKAQNVYQIQTNVVQMLKHIDYSVTHFVTSSQTQEILRKEMSGESFRGFNEIRKQLNHLQTLDTGIEDIVLVSFENNWLTNNDGLYTFDRNTYDAMYAKYMNLPNSSWIIEDFDNIVVNNAAKNSCHQYINLVKKLPILSTDTIGFISVLVPSCSLTEIMAEKVESESFVILDASNQIIAQSNPDYVGDKLSSIPDSILSSIQRSPEAGQFDEVMHETDYKITYRTSDYNNWTYLSLVKIDDLNARLISIKWLTITICLILLSISLIFSFFGSRNIYKPIRRLQKLITNSTSTTKKLEGKPDEFQLIETHIEDLLNKNNKLEIRMKNQVTQLKQFFIMRLLQGKVGTKEIPAKLASFNYRQEWKQLTILALQVDSFENSKFTKNDEDLLLYAINNVIKDLIPPDKQLTPVVINHTQVTILITSCENDDNYSHYLNQQAELIQQEVKRLFNISVSIGISYPYMELIHTKQAFDESKEALKYRLKLGIESIIYYDNLDRSYNSFISYPSNIKYKLFDAIKLVDKEKTDTELARFFDYLREKDVNHNQFQIILTRFLYDLLELKQLLGVDSNDLNNRQLLMEVNQLKTLESIENWFRVNLVQPLIEKTEERTDSQYKNLSDKIIHIIQQDYDKDISLDMIAAHLHYNPNYLSNIFQKETKRSFSEYLLRFRINKAKEWLIETDLSVKDIANKLQYNNSQNFIRSFRKIEGISPGKYRGQSKKSE